ncbi:N-acetyl-gamma-glutamyl-phosphate reductase [Ehrlichia ruminantium]|uniref:N-acetyl-gamma-glutamyl-phosphate reductase n=1 Tax=Ehrlichia ruminantium TaxID=779 RepID=UPI001FB1CC76|nr:N-acetyl-gamma-glutamyl-phosphate reductase [Ehrlichia ruminantium]UOD98678.1 N-acetyl-gamma-glutamyl-phosphate reductase [Ehrlichia ruminantium]
MSYQVSVAVVGATGYVGVELVRLLLFHPMVKIKYLCATQSIGSLLSSHYDHVLKDSIPVSISCFSSIDLSKVDVMFLCLPHGQSNEIVKKIHNEVKIIIDLSADFRIKDIDTYKEWYGAHCCPDLIQDFVYGLTEIYWEEIKKSRFVACPGCYATSALVPLFPLLRLRLVKNQNIIVDAKSGVSGAGRSVDQKKLFCEIHDVIKSYNISKHRHIPEIEQELCFAACQENINVQFVPNLIPVKRGMLSSIYLELEEGVSPIDIREALLVFYKDSKFILIDEEKAITTKSVVGTNYCYIGVFPGRIPNTVIIVCNIDNLLKGASGQAVQNFNIMMSCDETTALLNVPYL